MTVHFIAKNKNFDNLLTYLVNCHRQISVSVGNEENDKHDMNYDGAT